MCLYMCVCVCDHLYNEEQLTEQLDALPYLVCVCVFLSLSMCVCVCAMKSE